ncbi:MAG: ATP-binding cassette domain-containing protein [Streptosporangiales bacterium]|nr:ATP-binding cassette domain-containing protein [Streptosporangiales bacterium]
MSALTAWLKQPQRSVPVLVLAAFALYPVIRPYDGYPHGVLGLGFLLGVQAVSWNIISGYAGYVSLGHVTFLGLGSYTAALLGARTGLNPLIFAPAAGVVAVLVAVLIGAVVLRTRGYAFTIITIALLFGAQIVALNWKGLTGGGDGVTLDIPPWSRDIQNLPFYYMFFALLLLTLAFSAWIRRTKFGAGLLAIREDEGKAGVIGVHTTRYKILAFGASAFFIGMGGAVYAYYITFLNPTGAFALLGAVTIVLSALLGGRGTLWGPALGALIVTVAGELATVYGGGANSRVLVFGAALLLVVMFLPQGLLPTVEAWLRRRRGGTVGYTDQAGALVARAIVLDRPRPPAAPDAPPLLEVRGAGKRFGGLVAVDGAALTVAEGSVTGLIGPNGSGKTTLFNLITGTLRADAGEVHYAGRRIDRLPPWTRGHLGLGRTFQMTRLFRGMTVLENLVAPLPDGGWRAMAADAVRGHEADRAKELLGYVGLAALADVPAGSLSYGQQKLVEIVQVLMTEPRLVLLDEPTGGINPALAERVVETIRDLNRQGVTFLVVEHNIPMILGLCDRVTVFAQGRRIAEGAPEEIRTDPVVLDAYLGDTPPEPAPAEGGAR